MCVDDVFHVTCWTSAHEQLTGCGCRQNGERFNNAHSHVMKESKKNKKLCRIYLLKLFLLSFLLREIKLSVFVLWTKHNHVILGFAKQICIFRDFLAFYRPNN